MFNVQEPRCCITKDIQTAVSILLGFPSSRVEESASNSRLQLVTEDLVPGIKLVLLQSSKLLWFLGSVCSAIRQTSLLAISTSRTMRGFSSGTEEPKSHLVKESAKRQFLDM